ncbi:hypothetical protein MIDIC_140079 [Alphaproteobacteria bacterium]
MVPKNSGVLYECTNEGGKAYGQVLHECTRTTKAVRRGIGSCKERLVRADKSLTLTLNDHKNYFANYEYKGWYRLSRITKNYIYIRDL